MKRVTTPNRPGPPPRTAQNRSLFCCSLAIRTSGLLGEQYLALNVGFEDPDLGTTILKDGGTIQDTKSAMVLEDLIGQFLYNSKGGDNQNSGNDKAEAEGHTDATPAAGTTH